MAYILCFISSCNESEEILNCNTEKESSFVENLKVDINTDQELSFKVGINDVENFLKSLKCDNSYVIRPITQQKDTLCYIVKTNNGILTIAGDKRVYPILAESTKDDDSGIDINENFEMWIDCHMDELQIALSKKNQTEEQMSFLDNKSNVCFNQVSGNENLQLWQKISPNKSIDTNANTRSSETTCKWAVISYTYCDSVTQQITIPHLLSTNWGQEYPYNSKLPYDTSAKRVCYTGCTAVALAQMLYYSHYSIGKPTGLYHNIGVSSTTISGSTTSIGFTCSNYVPNSNRWDEMSYNSTYVGDLMLEIGHLVNMKYSGSGSSANISLSALSHYNLTYTFGTYNYQTVKNCLLNSSPVYVTANRKENGSKKGHAWIIDGLGTITRHYVTSKHFEYTENWMNESEYYESFDDLRAKYHINSEYDYIEEDAGSYTSEYLLMNWGWDGRNNNVFISPGLSDSWTVGDYDYKYDKIIYYDFR